MTQLDSIENQTILVQTTYHPTPHLETELEIMERLLQQGNVIYWIICEADFKVCFANPQHKIKICETCISRVHLGYQILKKGALNNSNLHLIKYSDYLEINDLNKNQFNNDFLFEDIKELKNYHYNSYDSGLATFSSLVSFTRNHEPKLSEHKEFISKGLNTGAYLYEVFQIIINKIDKSFMYILKSYKVQFFFSNSFIGRFKNT